MMKFIFGMRRNINICYKLILPIWVCLSRLSQYTQNKKFTYLSNISRKTGRMKLIFCLQVNIKDFFKFILSFLVCVVRHAQITQNNKFAISLQYLKKEMNDEVDFLYADKHQNLLQVRFNTLSIEVFCNVISSLLMGMIKHFQSTRSNNLGIALQYLQYEYLTGVQSCLLLLVLICHLLCPSCCYQGQN